MNRRRLKRGILIFAAAVILFLAAIILLQSPFAARFILNRAAAYLRSSSRLELRASRMNLNPLKGLVILENPTIQSLSAPDLPPLFTASRIEARLGIINIVRGMIDVEDLRVASPRIHYFVAKDGRNNFPSARRTTGPGPEFLISYAEVAGGSFKYEDQRNEISLSLPAWRLSVNGNKSTFDHRLDFKTGQTASFRYQDRTIPIDSVQILGTLQKKSIHLEKLRIASANSTVAMSGSMRDFSSPKISVRLEPSLDLDSATKALGLESLRGRLAGEIRAEGELTALQITALLKGSGISVGHYQRTGFDFRARAEWNRERVRFQTFKVDSPEGRLDGNAEFILGPSREESAVRSSIRDLNLYPLWKLINPPFDLASRSSGEISITWKGPFKASAVNAVAHLNLVPSRNAPGKNVLPLAGTLDAQMRNRNILGSVRNLSLMGAALNGRFSLLSLENIDADVQGNSGNIETTLAQIAQYTGDPDPSIVGIRLAGPAQFNAKIGGRLSGPRIDASADSPNLQAGQFKNLKARIDSTIENSQAIFRASVTLPQDQTILAQGTFDFRGLKTALQLDASTEQLPVPAVLSMFGSSIPAQGSLNANLHLDGPLDNLAGTASISGTQVSIYREPVGRFDVGLHLTGGEIQSDEFRILRNPQNSGADYIDASFMYGLNAGRFRFQATGTNLNLDRSGLPGGKAIAGIVNLSASGSGTFEQPEIDIKLKSENIRIGQTALGPISVRAELRSDQGTVEALAPRFDASATVHIVSGFPYPFEGNLRIQNSDLSLLGLKAPNKQLLTGTIAATLTGSGDLKDFANARFSAQIGTLDLHAGNLRVYTEGGIRADYRDATVEIPTPATMVSGNSRVEVAGKAPLRGASSSGSLSIRGRIDLAQAGGFVPLPEGLAAAGVINLDLALAGSPQNVSASGSITLDNGTVRLPRIAEPLSLVNVRASLQNGSLILQRADAVLGEGKISLQGEFPFGLLPQNIPAPLQRKEGPARFALELNAFRPEATGLLPENFSGLISMRATGQAAATDLRTLNAEITFGTLDFRINEIALGQKETSTIRVRNGIASVGQLSLSGADTSIQATGTAALFREGPLDLRLSGNLDAALLTFMNEDLKAAGKMQVRISAGGNWRAPSLSGVAEMVGGRLTLRNPRVVADSLTARLDLTPNTISVREFKSTLNGGTLTLGGTIGYQRGSLTNFNLKAALQDVFLDFPQGLKSASNGNLTVTSSDESIVIGGTIRVLESSYREPFEVTGQLMNYLRSQGVTVGGMERSPLLERIRFDVALRTTTPLLIQNNIAKAESTANLRVVGTFYEPSLVGRVTLAQGGEIVLNQRTYYIERGTITLTDQSQIRPELDIQAQTRVGTYDITMRLIGPPERLFTTLSSEPSLPESDVLSLLLTGKTTTETRGSEIQTARTQALSLIAGQAGEEVTREARQALHLSTFRIDPAGLIASESDVGARLTIGEDITRNFSLAYSMNLVDGGEQIWAAQYKVTRRLTTQATKQEDNSYRFEFRHDLQFGGNPSTRASRSRTTTASRFTIGSIRFEGDHTAPTKTLQEKFKLKTGDKYQFPKVQKGLDRLHGFYTAQKRLEADVRLHRETRQETVDLQVNIDPGPVVEFSYEGAQLPSNARERVERAWRNGVFETERIEDAVATIRRSLLREGYLQSKITPQVEPQGDKKLIRFQIDLGTKYGKIPVRFPGTLAISSGELANVLYRANLELDIYADPQKVVDSLKQHYRDLGYLQASVDPPRPKLDSAAGAGEVTIPVHEGPQFTVGDLEFSGNASFDYDQLWSVIPTSTGSIYNPKSIQDAVKALEAFYHSRGYNDVSVAYRISQDPETTHANVAFQVSERRLSVIREIAVEGNEITSKDFVLRQLDFRIGDALDFGRINETRRRLYATGAYSSADFQNEELPGQTLDSRQKAIRVRIRLREVQPYRIQYGFFFDTDRGPGGLFDVQNTNFLGRASTLGMKLRYDSDLKEARLYFNQPFVINNFPKMDAVAFAQKEDRDAFSARRIGFSLFREKELSRKYVFHYGYRYDHLRWNGVPPDPTIFQASVPVARVVATISRDTRDSILDATRGEFTSHSLEFGPRFLGSEVGFTRYFGQYFRYVPLDKYVGWPVKDREGNRLPASLVYAGALRLGLTSAFGSKEIISPERFFAGGGTTMRGFRQDLLGPTETVIVDPNKPPVERGTGGEAMFLFNNEIRFPIVGILQGVGFVDIGNVYPRISDFNFSLRKSAGLGVRIKIKFVPVRFDYGFKLDRKPGESRGAFFFSIGQAF